MITGKWSFNVIFVLFLKCSSDGSGEGGGRSTDDENISISWPVFPK